MVVEKIDDPVKLKALQPEWESLWDRCPAATPFQHPGWLLPWWDTFGSGQIFTFTVRDKSGLIAVAPLFLHEWEGRRQVTFIGNGVSDHLDILTATDGTCSLILRALAQDHCWDLCDLQDLSSGMPLLSAEIPAFLHAEVCPQYICSVIPLPTSWQDYACSLPHGLKRNLRRYRSQLESQGAVTFDTAGPPEFTEYIDALFQLHRARWAIKEDKGMLDGPAMERFHRIAARNLSERGLVRLHGLRLDGVLVAVVYLFSRGQSAYSYLGGFDPALARFSPGALIMEYTIQQAILEGVTSFDFLRGVEAYKSDWGARKTTTSRLLLRHNP